MNKKEFCNEIIAQISPSHEELTFGVHTVTKANVGDLTSLSILKKGEAIAPQIYIDGFYQEFCDGKALDVLADDIMDLYYNIAIPNMPDIVNYISDWENVKSCIKVKAINHSINDEYLKTVPHFDFIDLAGIFYIDLKEVEGGTIVVTNQLLESWNISIDGLRKLRNDKYEFCSMQSIIEGMLKDIGIFDEEDKEEFLTASPTMDMWVMTTENKIFGASAIFNVDMLDLAGKELDCNFYILPSSQHELIFIRDTANINPLELREMVFKVNREEVSQEEYLSDSVYYYEREYRAIEKVA